MTSTWPTRQTLLQVEPWVWRRWFRWNWYRQHKKSHPVYSHKNLSVSNLGFGLSYKIWRWNSNIFSVLGIFWQKCTLILIDSHQPVVLVLLERTWNHMSFQISASKNLELSTWTSKDMWHHRAWFVDSHFHLVSLGKENCTKPKRLTHIITHHFSKGFSFNNQLFFSKNSFGFTTTQNQLPWFMVNEKSPCDRKNRIFRIQDTGAKSMNGTSVHLAGSWRINQPQKSHWKLTFCCFFYKPNLKGHHYNLSSNLLCFFLKGFLNN